MWKFSNCFRVYRIYKLLEEFAADKIDPVHSCPSCCKAVFVAYRSNQLEEATWLRADKCWREWGQKRICSFSIRLHVLLLWGCFEHLDGFPDGAGMEVAVC